MVLHYINDAEAMQSSMHDVSNDGGPWRSSLLQRGSASSHYWASVGVDERKRKKDTRAHLFHRTTMCTCIGRLSRRFIFPEDQPADL